VFKNIYFKLLLCFLPLVINANEINIVPIANKNINYKSKIYNYDVRLIQENQKFKCKNYIDVITLKKNKYFAQHYIAKDRAICAEDVFIPRSNTIRFKFGNLEIEREGTVIKETDEYIKIKNFDGTIDKIYKDGRN
jgi:hypothetical protein